MAGFRDNTVCTSSIEVTGGSVPDPVFHFEDFELHCGRFQLLRRGRPLRVEPKPLELLILLVSRKGNLVSRQEIVERLWASDVFVDTDHGINTAIRKLRHLLRDDSENSRFIQTVTGMGYRFVAPVREEPQPESVESKSNVRIEANREPATTDGAADVSPVEPLQADPPNGMTTRSSGIESHVRLYLGISFVILLTLGSAAWYVARPLPSLQVLSYTRITHDGGHKTPFGTDGARLYFSRDSDDPIGEVSVDGGEARSIHVDLPQPGAGGILGVDGSALLVGSSTGSEFSLWKLQLPSGALQRIAGHDLLHDTEAIAASPDRHSIVLINSHSGDLIMMDGDGSHVRRFLSPPKEISRPDGDDVAWSPDGKKLRFTWNHRFWEVASDGSGLHPVLPSWRPGMWECCGKWTSDGSYFIFTAPENTSTNMPLPYGQLWASEEQSALFRKAKKNPVQLTSGPTHWIGVVPDKRSDRIFAEGWVERGELIRFDSRTREMRPFLGGISAEYLEYSPDGNAIVYVTFPEGILWRANKDGSNPVQLTASPSYPINPHWSPDGSQILYFTNGWAERSRAYTVPARGGESTPVVALNHPASIGDPTWTPDGRNIVYATAGSENSPKADIEIMNLATNQSTKVKGSEGLYSPRLSPDGRYIAALDPRSSLVVFEVATQKWTSLSKGFCAFPRWSRDSRWIYYARTDQSGIFRVDANGGEAEKAFDLPPISLTGSLPAWFGLDPDGLPILLKDAGSDEIYSLTLSKQ